MKRVLIIEDDERIAEFLVRGLAAEGYSLQLAKDGLEGLAMAQTNAFDVITLDLMLPGMDGREICRTLRMEQIHTKILMLTALETTADVVKGLRMGADDYLTKPFAFDELLARLEALTRTAPDKPETSTVLMSNGLRFDTQALKVTYQNKPIEMTSLEYALLEYLMNEKGKVVSRTRILQNVWGAHEDPMTNVVDVYVRRLRSKFSKIDAGQVITTVRGRGYRLD